METGNSVEKRGGSSMIWWVLGGFTFVAAGYYIYTKLNSTVATVVDPTIVPSIIPPIVTKKPVVLPKPIAPVVKVTPKSDIAGIK